MTRVKIAWVYLCSSELQKLSCGVSMPSLDNCRLGCPFLQKRKPGQDLKRDRMTRLESRLVDFAKERASILEFWSKKERDFRDEGLRNDEYIIHHLLEIIKEANPKIAFKELSLAMQKCQLPLFRDYYRRARSDISRLRKIQLDHERVRKHKEKMEILNAAKRGLLAGEGTDEILSQVADVTQGTSGTVEVIPGEEVNSH